jgi:hypothetical protein
MTKYIMLTLLMLLEIKIALSIETNSAKYLKIPFSDEYSIPTINTFYKDFKIDTILDNNLNFNYFSTKNFDLKDLDYQINADKIIINNTEYNAFYYLGTISIYDEKDYIKLSNVNSFVIDDKSMLSSIMISYLLNQLKEKGYIEKQIFYLDINHKQCFFGELPKNSDEYKKIFNDNFTHSFSYSIETKGVFKDKLYNFYIDNGLFSVDKNISYNINEKYSYIPYSLMSEIMQEKVIQNLNCEIFLIDQRGSHAIKCHKKNLNQLPPFFFVFDNYTISIPSRLLFEEYDENYYVSSIRTKMNIQYLSDKEEKKEENNEDEWIFGYSFLKYFNYTIFNYDERSINFYSDSFIRMYPPKINRKLYKNIFYVLNIILGLSSILLFLIRIQIRRIPLEAS